MLAAIIVYWSILSAWFLFGSPASRAAIVVLALFTRGVRLDVGISVDPEKIIGILACGLLLIRQIRVQPNARKTFIRLAPFLSYTLVVTLVGAAFLQSDSGAGIARSALLKPFVQLASTGILLSFPFVIADGIRDSAELKKFATSWLWIATGSSVFALLQFAYNMATGSVLLGTFRGTRIDQLVDEGSMVVIAGSSVQRVSSFAGEPKFQGVCLAISLAAIVFFAGRGMLQNTRFSLSVAAPLMVAAALLTFSTSVALILIPFGVYVLAKRGDRQLKFLIFGSAFVVAVLLVLYPKSAGDAIERQYAKLESITDGARDMRVQGYGSDKELPALIHLARNPTLGVLGVGVGASPFYFKHLVPRRFRGYVTEPSSGVTWCLYSFGICGIFLLLAGLIPSVKESKASDGKADFRATWTIVLLCFMVQHPIGWLFCVLGVSSSLQPGMAYAEHQFD